MRNNPTIEEIIFERNESDANNDKALDRFERSAVDEAWSVIALPIVTQLTFVCYSAGYYGLSALGAAAAVLTGRKIVDNYRNIRDSYAMMEVENQRYSENNEKLRYFLENQEI